MAREGGYADRNARKRYKDLKAKLQKTKPTDFPNDFDLLKPVKQRAWIEHLVRCPTDQMPELPLVPDGFDIFNEEHRNSYMSQQRLL